MNVNQTLRVAIFCLQGAFFSRSSISKSEVKIRPACGSILYPDLPTVRFDKDLGDGES
jgi:hypothetical protein